MKKIILLITLAVLGQQAALAGTGYYLVSTYPEEGQKSIDFKYWNAKPSGISPLSAPEIGFGYNVNSRWFTEVTASWFHTHARGNTFDAYEWQNDVMLTQGQYDFDLALHTNIERPRNRSEGYGVEFGPVLQTDIGRTQFNLNVFFERNYRAEQASIMEMSYQWQVKYRWRPKLEFGMQGFGELGEWNHWLPRHQQSHRAGPALFGRWDLAGKQAFKYDAAYLIGTNRAHNAKTVSLRLQYLY